MSEHKSWQQQWRRKYIEPSRIEEFAAEIRRSKKTIATLNGSFDLLHAGHLFMLYEASQVADILIVALNSDQSIGQYKSPHRPIVPLQERMELIAAIEFVDYVTSFDETDPRKILSQIRPDVHVNGEEYGENCIEAQVVKEGGGRLHLVKRIPHLATSQIIKKIIDCEQNAP